MEISTLEVATLYLFILASGVLSMDRALLVRGFLRIFVPLAAGSVAAVVRQPSA